MIDLDHQPAHLLVRLPRVLPIVVRRWSTGCPTCGSHELDSFDSYCQRCGCFQCPRCKLWRQFEDGGGDDPECNDCWGQRQQYRQRMLRRVVAALRARYRANPSPYPSI